MGKKIETEKYYLLFSNFCDDIIYASSSRKK